MNLKVKWVGKQTDGPQIGRDQTAGGAREEGESTRMER